MYALFGVDKPLRRLRQNDEDCHRVETRWDVGPLGGNCQRMAYNEQGDLIEQVSEHQEQDYGIDEAGRLSEDPTRQYVSRTEAHFHYEYDAHGN